MKWILGIIVLELFIYEAYALIDTKPGDTTSEIVWAMSRRPLVPFLFGLLMGHLFWQRLD